MGWRAWGGALCLSVAACDLASDPLAGVSFTSVAVSRSKPSVLYAAASVPTESGIFRSDDGGHAWRTLADWLPASAKPYRAQTMRLAVSPTDPDVVLLSTLSETFRTTDGGKSWSRVADVGASRIAFHPKHDDRAFALSDFGFSISADRGASWTPQKTSAATSCVLPPCLDFTFDANPDHMYAACGSNGVFVSTDSGACWTKSSPQNADLVVASPDAGSVWVAGVDGVYASQDEAKSFTILAGWSTLLTLTSAALIASPSGPMLVFGTKDIGVLGVRTNASSVLDLGEPLVRRTAAIDEIASMSDRILVAGESTCRGKAGVFSSANQGGTWDDVLLGDPFPPLDGPIGDPVPHEVMVIFYRDVSIPRQREIMAQHHVTASALDGPLLYFFQTAPDDPRSVADLMREFEALDEVDCCLNDFYLGF